MNKTTKLQSIEFLFVADQDYGHVIRELAAKARRWFFVSMFIVDTHSSHSRTPAVVHLAQTLGDAVARGLLVRVILGGSDRNFNLADTAFGAAGLLRSLGVPCVVASKMGMASHKKLVIADDFVLLGSHNWSEGAWMDQRQDSVLIKDAGFAALMAELVRRNWQELSSKENE